MTDASQTPQLPVRDAEVSIGLDSSLPKVPQLIDSVIVLAVEAQDAFIEQYVGYEQWGADLSEPLFWLESEDKRAEFVPFFVGSTSGSSQTWMWGWNNINGFPEEVVEVADEVYNFGEHFEEPLLTEAQQPLGEEAREAAGLPVADHGFGVERTFLHVAQALSGIAAPVWYRGVTGEDSFVWFLLSNPQEFRLPRASVLKTLSAITQALESGYISDGVSALQGYADKREGVTLDLTDDGAVLHTPDGDITVALDEQGRITRLQGTAGSQSQDAGASFEAAPVAAEAPPQAPAEQPKGFFGKLFGRR